MSLLVKCKCCGLVCTVVNDDFSTDTLANYEILKLSFGNWSISDGVLLTPNNGSLYAIHHSSVVEGHGVASVRVKMAGDGSVARLVGAFEDFNNYVELKLTSDTSLSPPFLPNWTLELSEVVDGVPTALDDPHTFEGNYDDWYQLRLCWDGDFASGSFGESYYLLNGEYEGTGQRAGLHVNPDGILQFDDFRLSKHRVDDSRCPNCGPSPGEPLPPTCRYGEDTFDPPPPVYLSIYCVGPNCTKCDSGILGSNGVGSHDIELLPTGFSNFMSWASIDLFWHLTCYQGPSGCGQPDNGFALEYGGAAGGYAISGLIQLPGNPITGGPLHIYRAINVKPCVDGEQYHPPIGCFGWSQWQAFCCQGCIDLLGEACTHPASTAVKQKIVIEITE